MKCKTDEMQNKCDTYEINITEKYAKVNPDVIPMRSIGDEKVNPKWTQGDFIGQMHFCSSKRLS